MMLTVPSILKQPARAYGADDDKSTPLAFSILYSIQITLNNRYWDTSGECRRVNGRTLEFVLRQPYLCTFKRPEAGMG
jgi:hypothetical protein